MNINIITNQQIENRNYWIDNITNFNESFAINSTRMEDILHCEIKNNGIDTLLGHLRLCGVIPEKYGHDTTEEKLYSKYTDIIIHEAYKYMGFNSLVLKERADVADVECANSDYSFVADAKAFRLSRTAKNQKDFKVQAMDRWKHGKPYAMVVCPIYQLPYRSSQIYQQAGTRSVCISTYTHLAVLARYAKIQGQDKAMALVLEIFQAIEAMNPSKEAYIYWQIINKKMLDFDKKIIGEIWQEEKIASAESIIISKKEALKFLSLERDRILRLSKEEAIKEVLKYSKIDNKIKAIEAVTDNGLLDFK